MLKHRHTMSFVGNIENAFFPPQSASLIKMEINELICRSFIGTFIFIKTLLAWKNVCIWRGLLSLCNFTYEETQVVPWYIILLAWATAIYADYTAIPNVFQLCRQF